MAMLGKTASPFPTPETPPPETQQPVREKKRSGGGTVTVLNVCALLSLIFGLFVLINTKSAVHEIEAAISLLIFVVCIAGAGVISELRRLN